MQHKTRWMIVCLAAAFCAGTLGAATVTSLNTSGYTWTTEITGTATDVTLPHSSPWTASGFTLTSPGSLSYAGMGGATTGVTSNGGEIDIATPAGGETALLLSLGVFNTNGNYKDNGGTLFIVLSDGESFSAGNGVFWFSSSTPITSVSVKSTQPDEPFILDLSYALSALPPDGGGSGTNPSPIPEPATLLLVIAGGLIFFGARRHWHRREA